MKTIEERIEELANNITPCNKHCRVNLCSVDYCNFDYEECEIYKNIYNALTEIAEYQKNIDDANLHERFENMLNGQKWDLIDKACKWLSDYFVFKHEAMSAQGCDAFLHEFRKAMGDRYEE